jgi:Myb-like DNA-binding domain
MCSWDNNSQAGIATPVISPANSVCSAFSQCGDAVMSGPPRRGRRKYQSSMPGTTTGSGRQSPSVMPSQPLARMPSPSYEPLSSRQNSLSSPINPFRLSPFNSSSYSGTSENLGFGMPLGTESPSAPAARETETPPQASPQKKYHGKWTEEENNVLIEFRAQGMKWEDISKRIPGRSAISCRLHYQNSLEKRSFWDEKNKNKLARLYNRYEVFRAVFTRSRRPSLT